MKLRKIFWWELNTWYIYTVCEPCLRNINLIEIFNAIILDFKKCHKHCWNWQFLIMQFSSCRNCNDGVNSSDLPTYTFWATILWCWKLLWWKKTKNKIVYLRNSCLHKPDIHMLILHNKHFPSPSRHVMTFKTTALVWRSVPRLGSTTQTCSELCPIQTFVWQLVTSVCWNVQVSNVIGQFTPWNLIGQFPIWGNLIGQFVVVSVWSVFTLVW